MRNLKRALSLTLASIMLLGMMVVGSSAASYQDVTDEHNVEAIEVLQAVGIMVGDEGNFNPEKNVTRNEMAVIMSNLMDYRVASYSGTSPFTDVPAWAEPYVAACYTNGITSGTSATTYNGSGNVTTAQAALMVMKALGYFQNASDFKDDWMLATTRQANNIDLLVGVKAGVREAMTRNDVAQLVLNGLESGTVEADNSNNINVSVGGAEVSVGGTKYNFVTSGQDYAGAINKKLDTGNSGEYSNGYIVELGEKLYQGSLTKDDAYGYYDRYNQYHPANPDAFGRPANHWEFEGKTIGTYTIDETVSFTKKVTNKALYNAIGSAACDYKWSVWVDGTPVGTENFGKDVNQNKTDDSTEFLAKNVGSEVKSGDRTGNGVLTQVFVDGNRGRVTLSVIHYYPAEVLRINNADGKDRSITLSNLDESGANNLTSYVFETENFTDDDIVAYSFSNKSNGIEEVFATEKLEGKVTQARAYESLSDNDAKEGDHFTVDGTKYNYNKTVSSAPPRRLTTENVNNNMVGYLDQYGYCIYIDESAASYDYAYVLTMGTRNDEFGGLNGAGRAGADGKTYFARLVLTDGTIVKAETDQEDYSLLHHIVSYSVDSKGVYALRDQSTIEGKDPDGELKGGKVAVDNGAAGIMIKGTAYTANADTVFILADSSNKNADDFNFRVYTGIKNVPDVDSKTAGGTQSVVAVGRNGIAKVVYIQDGDVSGTKNVIFIKADPGAKFDRVEGSSRNYVLTAVEDGEVKEIRVKEISPAADKLVNAIDKLKGFAPVEGEDFGIVAAEYLTTNTDGIVTDVKLYNEYYGDNADRDGYIVATGTERAERGTVGLGYGNRKGYSDDTIVVRYDVVKDDFFVEKGLNGIKNDKDDVVLGILDTDTLTGICYLNTESEAGVKPVAPKDKVTVTVDNKATGMTVTVDGKADATTTVDKGTEVTIAVAGTVPADKVLSIKIGDQEYTAVGSWKITVNANVTVTVELKEKGSQPDIDPTLKDVLKLHADDVKAGVKIVKAHFATADDINGSGKYVGNTALNAAVGDLFITVSASSNVTLSATNVNLNGTKNGMDVASGDTSNYNTNVIRIEKANLAKLDMTQTMTLDKLTSAITHDLEVKSDVAGLKFTTTTATVNETGDDIALKITDGLPKWATQVDVYFTVEGLTDDSVLASTKDEETGYQKLTGQATAYDSTALTNAMDIATATNAKADPEAGNVVITIKAVKVAQQQAKIVGATKNGGGNLAITTGTAFALPALDVAVGAAVKTAKVNIKIDGVTTDDATNYPTNRLNVTNTVTGGTAAFAGDSTNTHYTSDGKSEVVITVTYEITAIAKEAASFNVVGADSVSVKTNDLEVGADKSNSAAATLTVAKAGKFGASKFIVVKVVAGADTVEFKTTAKTADGNQASVEVPVAKGALKNITGDNITVIVSESDT